MNSLEKDKTSASNTVPSAGMIRRTLTTRRVFGLTVVELAILFALVWIALPKIETFDEDSRSSSFDDMAGVVASHNGD